jgi:hypothetical protein
MANATAAFFVALVVLGFWLSWVILRRLRKIHPEAWVQLGEPSMFGNMSPGIQFRLELFMWKDRYRPLNDRVLNRLFLATKLLNVLALAIIVLGLVLARARS